MADDDYQDEAVNKLELDVERNVLCQTIILSDHSEEYIFHRSDRRNDGGSFVYECRLCQLPNLLGERCLQTHIMGRKHQMRFAVPVVDVAVFRSPIVRAKPQITMKIAPGEPVPPGFEDEVKAVSQLQPTIDSCKRHALVAVEYIVELTNDAGRDPSYQCVLCDKHGNSAATILSHLISYNHRLKYLEKHFPTVIKEVHCYRASKDHRDIMTRIMITVCEAIEDKFGRLAPNVRSHKSFEQNHLQVVQSINAEKHINENQGSSLLEWIDHKAIKSYLNGSNSNYGQSGRAYEGIKSLAAVPNPDNAPIPEVSKVKAKRNSLDSISSLSDSAMAKSPKKPDKPAPKVVGTIDLRSLSRSLSPLSDDENELLTTEPKTAVPLPKPLMAPTPLELAMQSSEITKEKYSWEKFRCLVDLAIVQLQKTLKEHEKNPEKHPLYPEEWKKFWNRRYKELQAEKKDPSKHDFKPEWIVFWTRRMQDLHLEEIEAKKVEIRKRLKLPLEGGERDIRQQYALKINLKTTTLDNRPRKQPSPERTNAPSRSSPKRLRRDESATVGRRSPNRRRNISPSRRRSSRSKSPLARRRVSRSRSPQSRRRLSKSRSPRSRRRTSRSKSPSARRRRSPSSSRHVSRNTAKIRSTDLKHLSPVSDDSNGSRRRKERSRTPHRLVPAINAYPPPDYYGAPPHSRPAGVDEWGRPIYYPPASYYYRESEPKLLEEEETEPVTVVAVLRLLTALEDLLGSLGPKVIDLLAKALALEKVKANSSDDMLINEDTCVLFETIKEKLKGQLIADVVEKHKLVAVKRAVKKIAIVTHLVSERAKKALKEAPVPSVEVSSVAPSTVVTPSTVAAPDIDKAAIAEKIAAALVLQGKTDVTSEQLEELINVYIAMQKKSKESKEVVTTASYLQTVAPSTLSAPIAPEPAAKSTSDKPTETPSMLESLTDSDLETLLQNFKDLMHEEQQHLIAYLKKLECSQPLRVERLRRFVNVDVSLAEIKSSDDEQNEQEDEPSEPLNKIMYPSRSVLQRPTSRNSNHSVVKDSEVAGTSRVSNTADTTIPERIMESDDDDYSYDDVFRAASKNVKEPPAPGRPLDAAYSNSPSSSNAATDNSLSGTSNLTLADTQSMIANLMGSLHKNVRQNKSSLTGSTTLLGSNAQQKRQETAALVVNSDEMDLEPPVPIAQTTNVPYYQQQQQQDKQSYYQQQQQQQQQQKQQPYTASQNSAPIGHVAYPNGNSYSNNVAYPGFGNQQGYTASGQQQQPQAYRQHQAYPQSQQTFQGHPQQQGYAMQQQQQPSGYPMNNQYMAQQPMVNQQQQQFQQNQAPGGAYPQQGFDNNYNNNGGNQNYY